MAFNFRSKSYISTKFSKQTKLENGSNVTPKITNAQLSISTKVVPSWLRDNSGLKQLPGIYHGVLGQVQLQPGISIESQLANGHKLANRQQQVDYMNRFTDTERVHQLLSTSRLQNETLATIWAHVNKTFPGKLTNRELCLALALIALFQKLENDPTNTKNKDPFSLVKDEKKPPVPTLYPLNSLNDNKQAGSQCIASKSASIELTSTDLLVDLWDSEGACEEDERFGRRPFNDSESTHEQNIHAINYTGFNGTHKSDRIDIMRIKSNFSNLIDMDGYGVEVVIFKLNQVWLRFLSAMKGIFKRSFDILNVENSRKSAIEALRSLQGKQFSKQLCLCYPLAHNIKHRIDELDGLQLVDNLNRQVSLFDKSYIINIDDLMTSINEYWAVLINLFHESGQTNFIETIMDGLNYTKQTVISKTIDELVNELSSSGRKDVCSICHTKFYLVNSDTLVRGLCQEDVELVEDNAELLTEDGNHYYHPKCANFWLNHVDQKGLPFHREPEESILSPDIKAIT